MSSSVVKKTFGTLSDGRIVNAFTLSSGTITATVVELGATLISLLAPDRTGTKEECTLCHRTLVDLQTGNPQCYYGATIGRVGNRIAGGKFSLGNETYQCPTNNGNNCLHGGNEGFDKCLWSGTVVESATENNKEGGVAVRFSLVSEDGEEGFPGQVTASVTYSLTADNTLRLDYEATTSKTTPIAMTNHTYWNLSGDCRENILQHSLVMPAAQYLPVDTTSIPIDIAAVENTPFDFRDARLIGDRMSEIDSDPPGGYDHCYVNVAADQVDGKTKNLLSSVATVVCASSGRTMDVYSDQKGVQLYTGNYLDGVGCHTKHGAFCLETQAYPDAVNQWPEQVILQPGETWTSTTMHVFGVSAEEM